MKKPITKIAVAASILIAAFLSLTVWDTTVPPAYALEQALDTMGNMHWMHIVGKQNDLQPEYWISYPEKIIASKHSTGKTTYQHDRMCYSYDINDNALVISQSLGDAFEFLGNSPLGFIDHLKKMIKETEGEISQKTAKYLQKRVTVYNMSTIMDDKGVSVELVVDFEKKLPLILKMTQENSRGEPAIETKLFFDYPSAGPQDIYALGVPEDVKIVDNMPLQNVSDILSLYNTRRNSFSSDYIAVVTQTFWFDRKLNNEMPRQVDVIYRDDKRQRVDSYGIPSKNVTEYNQNWAKYKNEMGDSFDTVYQWWTQSELAQLAQVNLYDGKFYHQLRRDSNCQWTLLPKVYSPLRNDFRADDDVADLGWTVYLTVYSTPSPDVAPLIIIENDYSKQHGLICLETKTQGRIVTNTNNGVWAVAPSRTAYYLNPKKDYICQRFEQEEHFDAPWQEDKDWYSSSDEDNINDNPCVNTVREIKEYGQTDSGQWFPQEIEIYDPTCPEKPQTKKIYLVSSPDFPEGIFDPRLFSKYLSE